MVAVLLVGALRVSDGGLELGVLASSFLLYLRQFYDPLEDLGIFYNSLQSATAALNKIAALLAERPGGPRGDRPAAVAQPGARRDQPGQSRLRLPA